MRRRNRALAAGPGARFSKVPRPFPTRKAIRKTKTCLFCKAGLLICCKGNKNKNNCKVSCLETPSFWRYKENYVTRNTPEKFRDFRETGPRTWDEESRARAIALDPLPIWPYTARAILYFPIPHNALCLPPKFCINYCCGMLLGICRPPKSISQQWFMQNLGGKQSALWTIGK